MDGGIRFGGDVVKAVALGAKAVAVGRSWVWGTAAAGQRGVEHVAEIYRTEIEETLMLLGCPDVADLDRSRVDYPRRVGSSRLSRTRRSDRFDYADLRPRFDPKSPARRTG